MLAADTCNAKSSGRAHQPGVTAVLNAADTSKEQGASDGEKASERSETGADAERVSGVSSGAGKDNSDAERSAATDDDMVDQPNECSGSAASSPDGSPKKPPEERLELVPFPAVRSYTEGLTLMSLPYRSLYSRMKMPILNIAFPGAIQYADFCAGAIEAFRLVHVALCAGDRQVLRDLLSDELLQRVCDQHTSASCTLAPRYELHAARVLGLLGAKPEQRPESDGVLRVQALFYAEEDAVVETNVESSEAGAAAAEPAEIVRYRQRRLHAWTFEKALLDDVEQPDDLDWLVVDMDKTVWPPKDFPPERIVPQADDKQAGRVRFTHGQTDKKSDNGHQGTDA